MKKLLTGLGIAALIAGQSVAVSANVALDRASSPVGQSEAMGLESGEIYLFAVLLLAIIGGTIIASDDDDDFVEPEPYPNSP